MHYAAGRKPKEAVSIARALDRFLAATGLSERLRHSTVLRAWSEALGGALARHARAVRFAQGELYVEIDSAPHMHELSNYTGEQYRQLANTLLGSEQIRRVHFQLKR